MLPFLYLLFSLLAFLQLRLAYKAGKKYGFPFLHYYYIYLIFFLACGFIKFIGSVFVLESFSDRIEESIVATQLALLIFPIFAMALYTMLHWISRLSEKTIPPWLKIGYWAVQSSLFAYMVLTKTVKPGDQSATSDRILSLSDNAQMIILVAIILLMFIPARRMRKKIKKQFIKSLGFIYLISFAVLEGHQELSDRFLAQDLLLYLAIAGGLYFCVNIPALIYILAFLRHHHKDLIEQPLSEDEMGKFCIAHDITPREKEIIESIVIGKSNKEIGKSLHISVQTVKNINYNLYKKIGIKNRIQLLNRIQEFKSAD